jgi:hypothetical protein
MTGFPVRFPSRLLPLALIVALAGTGEARAQGEPVRLEPLPAPGPAESAVPARPATPADGDDIQVDSLGALDEDSIGVLTADKGGLGAGMWAGTPRALAERLVVALPVGVRSPAMRDLMRRLLLSEAVTPAGPPGADSLVALRARALAGMGHLEGLEALLGAMPSRDQDMALARIEADLRFLTHDNARACAVTAQRMVEDDNLYWQRAFVFCQALAGEGDKAAMGVALLREMGDEDQAFATRCSWRWRGRPRCLCPPTWYPATAPESSEPSPPTPTFRWSFASRPPSGPRPRAPWPWTYCANSMPAPLSRRTRWPIR